MLYLAMNGVIRHHKPNLLLRARGIVHKFFVRHFRFSSRWVAY
jgi:hypothetical protein